MNMVGTLINIYGRMLFDPKAAFERALGQKNWTLLFPFVLAVALTFMLNAYYYYHVDFAWLLDQLVGSAPAPQRAMLRSALTRDRLLLLGLIGVIVLTLLINLGRAFIFWIILKVRGGESQRFTRLFAITMWAAAPLALILPAGILNISMAPEGRIAGNDVNPVSLNQLLFHLPSSGGWGQMLSTFSLVNVWEIVLIAVGLHLAAGLKLSRAALIAMVPDVIVYGIWSLSLAAASVAGA
jgi:hypothetical protein